MYTDAVSDDSNIPPSTSHILMAGRSCTHLLLEMLIRCFSSSSFMYAQLLMHTRLRDLRTLLSLSTARFSFSLFIILQSYMPLSIPIRRATFSLVCNFRVGCFSSRHLDHPSLIVLDMAESIEQCVNFLFPLLPRGTVT